MRVFARHAAPRGNPRLHIRDVPLGETIRSTRHTDPVRTICGATLPVGSHDVAPVTPARLSALDTITPGSPGWLCQTCRDRNSKPTTRTGTPAMPAKKSGIPYSVGDTVVVVTSNRRAIHGYQRRTTLTVTRVSKSSVTLSNGRRLRPAPAGAWVDASIPVRDVSPSTPLHFLTSAGSAIDRLALTAIRRGNVEELLIAAAGRVPTSSDPAAEVDELARLANDARVAVRNHVAAEAAYRATRSSAEVEPSAG